MRNGKARQSIGRTAALDTRETAQTKENNNNAVRRRRKRDGRGARGQATDPAAENRKGYERFALLPLLPACSAIGPPLLPMPLRPFPDIFLETSPTLGSLAQHTSWS